MQRKQFKYSISVFVLPVVVAGWIVFRSVNSGPNTTDGPSVGAGTVLSSREAPTPRIRKSKETRARDADLDARNAESRQIAKLWGEITREKTQYFDQFKTHHVVGLGRSRWLNSPQVCFWIDQLSSENPARVAIATKVFEQANLIVELANVKAKKEDERQFSQEEWESHLIFREINLSRSLIQSSRFRANVEDPNAQESNVKDNRPLLKYVGDDDDSLILKDVQPILEFFVPRLENLDNSVVDSAKSVIDTFTFGLFRDQTTEWWENTLMETKRRHPSKESIFRFDNQ